VNGGQLCAGSVNFTITIFVLSFVCLFASAANHFTSAHDIILTKMMIMIT